MFLSPQQIPTTYKLILGLFQGENVYKCDLGVGSVVIRLECSAELPDNGIWDTNDPCIGIKINSIIPIVGYDEVLNELNTPGETSNCFT